MHIILFAAVLVMIIVVTRRVSPLIGGVLGALAALGVGIWGTLVMDEGASMTFVGQPLSRPAFLTIVVAWFALETFGLIRAWKLRKARRAEAEAETDPGPDDES